MIKLKTVLYKNTLYFSFFVLNLILEPVNLFFIHTSSHFIVETMKIMMFYCKAPWSSGRDKILIKNIVYV